MTQEERVINFLFLRGKEGASMVDICRTLFISAPHAVIRDIRKNEKLQKRFGIESITSEWRTTIRKEYNSKGEEITIPIRYKQYFLNKMA